MQTIIANIGRTALAITGASIALTALAQPPGFVMPPGLAPLFPDAQR